MFLISLFYFGLIEKELLEPNRGGFEVSFKVVFVVNVNDAEPDCVTSVPFEVIPKCPEIISSHSHTIPVKKKKNYHNHYLYLMFKHAIMFNVLDSFEKI